MPTFGLTWVWPMPSIAYSTGSSTVRMLRVASFSNDRPAYREVVLPEPVGPVTRMMPFGSFRAPRKASSASVDMPSRSSVSPAWSLSRIRSTTRSPARDGRVETRTSSVLPPRVSGIRPSCGTRFSAMSSRAMTLMRDTSSGVIRGFSDRVSRSTPSTRMRTVSAVSNGSRWMSDAPDRTASAMMPLIRRITGASSAVSSRSAAAGMSSIRLSSPDGMSRSSPSAAFRWSPA